MWCVLCVEGGCICPFSHVHNLSTCSGCHILSCFNVDIPIYMPAFLLIPAMTCSCLPCNYSSHMALVSLLICLIEPLAPSWLWGCLSCLIDSAMEHRVAKQYRIISNNPYTLLFHTPSFSTK